jgi:hypothetical protein
VCYENRTVIFGDGSVIKKIKSAGVFDFYLKLYFHLREGPLERPFT